MNIEIIGVIIILILTILLSIPIGVYISGVIKKDKTFLDFLKPIERRIFCFLSIDSERGLNWKENLLAMLALNFVFFILGITILSLQGILPLNPESLPSLSPDLAFHTAISFLVNCNLQHYSGEITLSYFSQIFVVMFFQFVSAATGLAICFIAFDYMALEKEIYKPNFIVYFILSITRILLPFSLLIALVLMLSGSPMTLSGNETIKSIEGKEINVAKGPIAGIAAIKQIGTNGGGYMGTNSAHPFENPSFFTNVIETSALFILPSALIIAFGFYTGRKKTAYLILSIMTSITVVLLIPSLIVEASGNPALEKLGVDISAGNLEGKEMRIGAVYSSLWAILTTTTSNGSVNSMMGSMMPLTLVSSMLAMMINAGYGGVGVGFLNFYIFIIISVFISGLMIGRTPEFLGKKIEAKEIKIAVFVILIHPMLMLIGDALAVFLQLTYRMDWLNNKGLRGFTEMLYEFTSAAANNGSGMEGLKDSNVFWNISTAIIMFIGRYFPIIGALSIAGLLSEKKTIPETSGTLKTDTIIFGIMILSVILIVAALAFFPALALGPIAESFIK